ncbi:hypothetical protein [Siphonobacter sp. SORGH_AS_0500]|uniref:hypothetical protein n=1 Tax=Siphonobacter sp. SORGH_AS_0500 TaxID=1864824 RepID=UPI002863F3C0|nr:hypothetical protein [Siphonobacter sp. SORGH_AS_0500]MDR6194709.1 hypothetical protein [Siphonobacter sp. SORGH_AS_0500]
MPLITDLVTLDAYLKTVQESIPELKDYQYLDAGDDFEKELQGYFNQRYKGPVLFLGMFEATLMNNQAQYWENTFQAHLSVQVKAAGEKPADKLKARNDAWALLLKVIGKIRMDYEDSVRVPGQPKYIFRIYEDTLRVTDRVGTITAYGWDIDFQLGIPVNTHLFS